MKQMKSNQPKDPEPDKLTVVYCDFCPRFDLGMRSELIKQGWILSTPNGETECPECKEKV